MFGSQRIGDSGYCISISPGRVLFPVEVSTFSQGFLAVFPRSVAVICQYKRSRKARTMDFLLFSVISTGSFLIPVDPSFVLCGPDRVKSHRSSYSSNPFTT